MFSWIVANKISFNTNKTVYLLFISKHFNNPNCRINIDSNIISPNDSAKKPWCFFQFAMSMDKHISAIIKSRFLQLHDFHRIRSFISKTAAITLAIITLYISYLTTVAVFLWSS